MKTIRVGRSSANDIQMSDSVVSGQHAVFTIADDGRISVKDLNSTNGTFVNGKRIADVQELKHGDKVLLGTIPFEWESKCHSAANKTVVQPIGGSVSPVALGDDVMDRRTIGRDANCSIVFQSDVVSRNHATLVQKKNGEIWIMNHSTNGTYVNGQKVENKRLNPGDLVLVANKYRVDWEKEFRAVKPASTGVGITKIWTIAAAVVAVAVISLASIKWVIPQISWSPQKVYSTYKSNVVLVRVKYAYVVTYKGESIENRPLIGEYAVIGTTIATGTGFFVSKDGKILTNKHVVDQLESDKKEQAELQNKMRALLANQVQEYYNEHFSELTTKGKKILKELYQVACNVELNFVVLDLRVGYNDTYVNSTDDLAPCSIVKVSDDDRLDVAMIQLNSKKTPDYVQLVNLEKIADAKSLQLGSPVYSIGFPRGFTYGDTSIGLEANNQDGKVTQECGDFLFGHNIQIEHGASGSPVFDKKGRFAGLICSGLADSQGNISGYNFAVLPFKVVDFVNK